MRKRKIVLAYYVLVLEYSLLAAYVTHTCTSLQSVVFRRCHSFFENLAGHNFVEIEVNWLFVFLHKTSDHNHLGKALKRCHDLYRNLLVLWYYSRRNYVDFAYRLQCWFLACCKCSVPYHCKKDIQVFMPVSKAELVLNAKLLIYLYEIWSISLEVVV